MKALLIKTSFELTRMMTSLKIVTDTSELVVDSFRLLGMTLLCIDLWGEVEKRL